MNLWGLSFLQFLLSFFFLGAFSNGSTQVGVGGNGMVFARRWVLSCGEFYRWAGPARPTVVWGGPRTGLGMARFGGTSFLIDFLKKSFN